MTDVAATFRKPFSEAVAALDIRLRELRPTYGAADPLYSGHDRAFMVAGAVKADLLADLAAAVRKAQVEGTGYDAFRRDFREIVERRGWHGWTGEGTAKGEEWRMRTIYQTNMRVSYMAGRHAQLLRGNYKYWVYRHSGAAHPRLNHLAWDGIALPPDHPFWARHYPPNGWGCGCDVYGANTEAGIRRVGGVPGKVLPEGWDATDPRTGLPPGIGTGWGEPTDGGVSGMIRTIAEKSVHWPHMLARSLADDLPDATADRLATSYRTLESLAIELRRYAERVVGLRNGAAVGPVLVAEQRSIGVLTEALAGRIGAVAGQDLRRFEFILEPSAVRHVLRRHGAAAAEALRGQIAVDVRSFGLLPRILDAPDRVVEVGRSAGGSPVVEFIRTIAGIEYHVVAEVRGKRRTIAVTTMWARRASGDPSA